MTHPATNIVPFPLTKSPLIDDINAHAKLLKAYLVTARVQKNIAQGVSACQAAPGRRGEFLRSLPAQVRVRIALRAAIKKAVQDGKPSTFNPIAQELAYLGKLQKTRSAKILKLQNRVLSAQPASRNEAIRLFRFITMLVSQGQKIDQGLLAGAMKNCALAKAKTANITDAPSLASMVNIISMSDLSK